MSLFLDVVLGLDLSRVMPLNTMMSIVKKVLNIRNIKKIEQVIQTGA